MLQDIECERCSGTGELVCNRCGGTGSLPGFATWGGGFTSCDVCYGRGYTTCPECNGDGYVEDCDEEEDEWESDDSYRLDKQNDEWINNNFNSPHPNIKKEEKYHPIHPNTGRIYSIYNKDYLLTDEGFKRVQNGSNYYFSYEKSMALINSGEAVLRNKTVQEDAISHINTSSNSNDMVIINIDNEVIDKITYEHHNQKVTTYNKSGHTIRHWGVPYSLFLDYVNSSHHYKFRNKYFAEYGPKIREEHKNDFVFSQFEDSVIDDLLKENGIVPITIQEIKPDGSILYLGGVRLIDKHDYTWDNIRGYRLNEDVGFFPYTPRSYSDEDDGYWFLISKSLTRYQIQVLSETFDYKYYDDIDISTQRNY